MQNNHVNTRRGFLGAGLDFRTLFVLGAVGLLIAATIIVGIFVPPRLTGGISVSTKSNQVTLYGFPGNGSVQMFDTLAEDAKVMAEIPDGTACDKLSGPTDVNEYGVKMSFYFVDCGGKVGFVNARWVKD